MVEVAIMGDHDREDGGAMSTMLIVPYSALMVALRHANPVMACRRVRTIHLRVRLPQQPHPAPGQGA